MAFSASNFLPSTNGAPLATNHTFDTVKRLGYYIAQGLDLSRSDRGADTTPERSLGSTSSVSDNSGDHRDAAGPSSRSSTSVTAFHTFVHTRTIQPNATKPRTSSGRVSAAVQFLNQTATGNSTLAPTGSGYVYANACNQAIASWSSSWVYQYIPPCVTSTTDYLPAPSSQMLTECDGIPRMAANFTTPAMPIVDCAVGLLTSPSPAPKPNCTILASDCGKLLSSWSTVHSVPAGITLGCVSCFYPAVLPANPLTAYIRTRITCQAIIHAAPQTVWPARRVT